MATIKKNQPDPKKKKAKTSPKVKAIDSEAASVFPIVGIGASAGGLEALEQFFGNMPKDSGMAFVVIQHLDPTHKGIMPELLQRITSMKVFQASDRLKVQANCVYVIPPNKSLSILNGALYCLDPVESRGLRLPVDVFFRSLAEDMQDKSIGIILSGMGSDGSLGVKAIKEKDGIVLVQNPDTAKFNGMPNAACKTVVADIVESASELPSKLIAFLKFIPVLKKEPELDDKSLTNLDKIILLLREQTGNDFSLYKKNTLIRRIDRRKGVHQIEKLNNYVRFCQENAKEVEILYNELLIGVTSFFRDEEVWQMMKEYFLPKLLGELPNGYVLRAWVPGCSTGEEAFSLAIIFHEVLEKMKPHKNLTLQIFATDLDTDSIDIARKGFFHENITADVSPKRLNRFFKMECEGFRINSEIREMIVFASQNVIKDPPFTKLNILTCRNMLIYMESQLQNKLLDLFHYSLNPGGLMVLGTSETLGGHAEGFDVIQSKLKIFKRTSTKIVADLVDFPSSFYHKPAETQKKAPQKTVESIQVLTDQLLLQRFAPASVLLNNKGDIVYITGRIGKYLEPAAGKANMNIYAIAREGLLQALPGAMRKAGQSFNAIILRNIKVGTNGDTHYVDVTVQRIDKPDALRDMIIILFNDVPAALIPDKTKLKKGKSEVAGKELDELMAELQRSNEDLQTTREEMQTSQEELKSTNEEFQSTNEELQSTNEELTTSKEEMPSLNEELQTVNTELQSRVSDFIQANEDMKNLLNSTEIATLFLDKDLNIRRFTDETTNNNE